MCALAASAQTPPPPFRPAAEDLTLLRTRAEELGRQIGHLRSMGRDAGLLADVEIYHKAVTWILRYPEEFYTKAYVANALAAIDTGMERAHQLEADKAAWPMSKGRLIRAYRSRVDSSVQPYGLLIPADYDGRKPMRLDVNLHGRGATLNEVSFIAQHESAKPVEPRPGVIQLNVFGRTNNAYRWSGETDVFEAIESVRKRYSIDPDRVALRGFSMGGAGTWHIGLHFPDRWAAIEAGAGFTDTIKYARLSNLPDYQMRVLHIYDAVDYSLNAFNVPTVGYGGDKDPQLQASINIREKLAAEGLPPSSMRALFLVGPNIGHQFHPESKKESDAFIDSVMTSGRRPPEHVRFVTYTTRYSQAFGIAIEGLEKQYERAEIDWRPGTVKTVNISRLRVPDRGSLTVDGQKFDRAPEVLERRNGRWSAARGRDQSLRKRPGLQGPIDDAFMDAFLCVRPSGEAPAAAVQRLTRFQADYAKWLRADPVIKDDQAVTAEDIRDKNLILFGDPSSNRLIRRIAARLPVSWTEKEIRLGGKTYDARQHVLVLIYPNPLNPARYIVLNSGHTFGETEFRGTNALLFPRLGDYAILDLEGRVITAGLFDDQWRID
jgi:pimeloyl-ACP methyl ester carboxylesterase